MKPAAPPKNTIDKNMLGVFRYSKRAITLVWQTSPRLTLGLALLTLIAGVLPALMAYVGQLIVDSVVAAMEHYEQTQNLQYFPALLFVVLEGALVLLTSRQSTGLSGFAVSP